jgi:hypothetical protein
MACVSYRSFDLAQDKLPAGIQEEKPVNSINLDAGSKAGMTD